MTARYTTTQFTVAKGEPCIVVIDDENDPLHGAWFGEIISTQEDPENAQTVLVEAVITGDRVSEYVGKDDPAVHLSLNGTAYRVLPASPEYVRLYAEVARLNQRLVDAKNSTDQAKADTEAVSRRSQTLERSHVNFQDRLLNENIVLRTRKARDAMTDPRLVYAIAKAVLEKPDLLDELCTAVAANKGLSDKLRLHFLRRQTA